jgi:hypothetical protein
MTSELIDERASLARVRDDLMVAIVADQRRSRRRRRACLVGLALATIVVSGTAFAAATGTFQAVPEHVRDIFDQIPDAGRPVVDASKAVEIGEIDDHVAYAAPTSDGGFCVYFAPDPRSGRTGSTCIGADPNGIAQDEIVFSVQLGSDGGFLFGRVGAATAAKVAVEMPRDTGSVTTQVGTDGFFVAELPSRAMDVLFVDGVFDERRIEDMTASATDASGTIVAASSFPQPMWLVDDAADPTVAAPPG